MKVTKIINHYNIVKSISNVFLLPKKVINNYNIVKSISNVLYNDNLKKNKKRYYKIQSLIQILIL